MILELGLEQEQLEFHLPPISLDAGAELPVLGEEDAHRLRPKQRWGAADSSAFSWEPGSNTCFTKHLLIYYEFSCFKFIGSSALCHVFSDFILTTALCRVGVAPTVLVRKLRSHRGGRSRKIFQLLSGKAKVGTQIVFYRVYVMCMYVYTRTPQSLLNEKLSRSH